MIRNGVLKEEMKEPILIEKLNNELENYYQNKIFEDNNLSRKVVSFQANKKIASFRWYKYKEAFSASLVEYFISKYELKGKRILDPFVGVGTTLFSASSMGCDTVGIELLPVGQKIIESRMNAHFGYLNNYFDSIKDIFKKTEWHSFGKSKLNELRITKGAYPQNTHEKIEKYLSFLKTKTEPLKSMLELALLSILEEVSYTRKDGQYLRWDYRANRSWGKKPFNKCIIKDFDDAVCKKLKEIVRDLNGSDNLTLFDSSDNLYQKNKLGNVKLIKGSCLQELQKLDNNSFNAVITSPPYCNRYDYTRTYALELALLGINEKEMSELRQDMLTCTVENREKKLLDINQSWNTTLESAKDVELLNAILEYLENLKIKKMLNNNSIIRMIRGYFYELSCVIYELHRILYKNSLIFMVNDNVRYAGVSIPVDLILSNIAEKIGFEIINILVLPQKKGNSSQQMGNHGRVELRKCVYIWKKA